MKAGALLLFLFLSVLGGEHMDSVDINHEINAIHEKILTSGSEDERVLQMRAMEKLLTASDQQRIQSISDDAVDAVATILEIDGDVGRYYGARALAAMACRAKRALPSLRKALNETMPIPPDLVVAPSVSPYREIEVAMTSIEQTEGCQCLPK